jgi:hypothetical protein
MHLFYKTSKGILCIGRRKEQSNRQINIVREDKKRVLKKRRSSKASSNTPSSIRWIGLFSHYWFVLLLERKIGEFRFPTQEAVVLVNPGSPFIHDRIYRYGAT